MRLTNYSWDDLNRLLETSGGAVFIARPTLFRQNVERFLAEFRKYYLRTNLGYSYKTNYLPLLCVNAHALGLYAEVVSGTEYQMARVFDVQPERIIFNGPVKTNEELFAAISDGALVNIDSLDEVKLVVEFLKQHPTLSARIGLRCNLEMRWQGKASRFGLSDANGDLTLAAHQLRRLPNVKVEGLHSHLSYDRSIDSYRARTERMIELTDTLFPDQPPKFLDLGGGFCGPIPQSLKYQMNYNPPEYSDYAMAIGSLFAERYGVENGPELILEPGVGIVANVLEYVCRVETTKRFSDRNVAVTSGCASHLKIVPNTINLPLEVYRTPFSSQNGVENVDLVGFTCLEHDVMYQQHKGPITRGDILVFTNVGAYSFVTAPTFIRTPPPIVMATENGWQTLMKQESVKELLKRFYW